VNSPRRLSDDAVEALKSAVVKAMQAVAVEVSANTDRIADIYVGRESGGSMFIPTAGVPVDIWMDAVRASPIQGGNTGVNLLMSRLLQVFVSQTPGRPRFTIEPKTKGAQMASETQETIFDIALDGSETVEAVRRAAWLDPIQNHVGVRLCKNEHARDATDVIKWQVIEASDCGYEPFSRRFTWHARVTQWGDIPAEMQKLIMAQQPDRTTEPNPWDAVALAEVFDEALALEKGDASRKGCRVHVFVNLSGKFYRDKRAKRPDIGTYVVTHNLRCAPLSVIANMEPAPNEDVAPAEAASWVPVLATIQDIQAQIKHEVDSSNSVIVYDEQAIQAEQIAKLRQQAPGTHVYLAVNGREGRVDSLMRPVERDSILGELLTCLQTELALLDDLTGVGPQDRGLSINPSKSATEASVLSASSSRRTAARLRTQSKRWEAMARILFEYQQEYFGKLLEVPTEGVVRTLQVPNPETCRYAFKISLDEMENLSRRGRLDTNMLVLTTVTQFSATFPQGAPKIAREALRRMVRSAGWVDADAYITAPFVDNSPQDRYTTALESGKDIPVYPDDDHLQYIAFYGKKMEAAVMGGNSDIPMPVLVNAVQKHQMYVKQNEAMQAVPGGPSASPVPGVSAQGAIDNNISRSLDVGLTPVMSQQTLQ
jgi:hypothetical protein